MRPYALSIAGFDSSGGAGILADIKTMEQLKVIGLGVLTANTLQTEDSFLDLSWFSLEKILKAIAVMMKNYEINYIKIGILPDIQYLKEIVECIRNIRYSCRIIWDPVLKSSSGKVIFSEEHMERLKEIVPELYLITPNYIEYQYLQDKGILNENQNTSYAVYLKGGHRQEAAGEDVLIFNGKPTVFAASENIETPKHGSGCVLSSAITACLALGNDLETACSLAKTYTAEFLKSNNSLLGYHHEKIR